MVVQDREGENSLIDFIFTLNKIEELNNSLHCKGYAINVLLVCDVKCSSAALHFIS